MVTWAFWLYASTVKQKNAVGGFTAHVAIAAWAFCIQKPRHCGGVKKSLSGEQRKEAPNVLIY